MHAGKGKDIVRKGWVKGIGISTKGGKGLHVG